MSNFVFEAMKMLEGNIDKASISPTFQGQMTKGSQTKYEIEQQLTNSIRTIAGLIQASVNRRRQRSAAMLRLALKYYPKMKYGKLSQKAEDMKKFVVSGGEGMGRKEIVFGDMPTTPKEHMDLVSNMMSHERSAKAKGEKVKMFYINGEEAQAYKHVINFRVNPQQRSSKSSDIAEIEKKYTMYMNDPNVQQRGSMAVSRMLVRANGDDVGEFLPETPQQPQQPQQQPPQGQPQPGQPPQAQPPEVGRQIGNPQAGMPGNPNDAISNMVK